MLWGDHFRGAGVVVTGASSGIGRATSLAFAAAGARVALVARRRELLDEVATEARTLGGEALVVPADVSDPAQVRAVFATIDEGLGPVDLVVNNAGVLVPGQVVDLDAADLQRMLQVNLFGALFVMQESVRRMRPRGRGSIVNVASLAGRRGVSPLGGYSATKFALVGLTEALRTELYGHGVHVGLVLPGVVDTPMVDAVSTDREVANLWPRALTMPVSWVVWGVFAAARFRLLEVSVPPGAATIEKLAALAPGTADSLVQWTRTLLHWISGASGSGRYD